MDSSKGCLLCLQDVPEQEEPRRTVASLLKQFWNSPLHWEAAALGLASVLLSLGLLGLLLSICSACIRQRRAQKQIAKKKRRYKTYGCSRYVQEYESEFEKPRKHRKKDDMKVSLYESTQIPIVSSGRSHAR